MLPPEREGGRPGYSAAPSILRVEPNPGLLSYLDPICSGLWSLRSTAPSCLAGAWIEAAGTKQRGSHGSWLVS